MVAIVAGNVLGLFDSTLNTLGSAGMRGNAKQANFGEGNTAGAANVYVNSQTGNVTIQALDEQLSGTGLDNRFLRTYNSRGLANDDNGDNWRHVGESNLVINGQLNSSNSHITRLGADGSNTLYYFDPDANHYYSNDGQGAHDSIRAITRNGEQLLQWREGSTYQSEYYDQTSGRLVRREDSKGNGLDYRYDNEGRLSLIVDEHSQQTLQLTYDNQNRLWKLATSATVDGTGVQQVEYGYDSDNRLKSVTVDLSPDGNLSDNAFLRTEYSYHGSSNLVKDVTQQTGNQTPITVASFLYDLSDRVTHVTDQNGTTRFDYTTVGGHTVVTDAEGNAWTYEFTGHGLLERIESSPVNGVTESTSFVYNANEDVIEVVQGDNNRVRYFYDSNGNRVLEVDSEGNYLTRVYSEENLLLSETTYTRASSTAMPATNDSPHLPIPNVPNDVGEALTTTYVYGGRRELRFVVSPEGRVTEYQYNGFGLQTKTIEYGTLHAQELPPYVQVPAQNQNFALGETVNFTLPNNMFTDLGGENLSLSATLANGDALSTIGLNFNSATATISGTAPNASGAYSIVISATRASDGVQANDAFSIQFGQAQFSHQPIRIEAENYDRAYDTGSGNAGGGEGAVDTQGTSDVGGGMNVGWTAVGEWMEYDVHIAEAGYFAFSARVASDRTTGAFSVDIDDQEVVPVQQVGSTGGWQTWQTTSGVSVGYLEAGQHTLRFNIEGQSFNVNWFELTPQTQHTINPIVMDLANDGFNFSALAHFDIDGDGLVEETPWVGEGDALLVMDRDGDGRITQGNEISFVNELPNATTSLDGLRAFDTVVNSVLLNNDEAFEKLLVWQDYNLNGVSEEGELSSLSDSGVMAIGLNTTVNGTQPSSGIEIHNTVAAIINGQMTSLGNVEFQYNNLNQQEYSLPGLEGYLDIWTKNSAGKPLQISENEYDPLGNLSKTIQYETIDDQGEAILDNAVVTRYVYTAHGELEKTIAVRGTGETAQETIVTQYTYDGAGRVLSRLNNEATTTYNYTNNHLTIRAVNDATGLVTLQNFDDRGRMISASQGKQNDEISTHRLTQYRYDSAGRLRLTIDNNGNRSWIFYNNAGHIANTVNAEGEVKSFVYNDQGLIEREVSHANPITSNMELWADFSSEDWLNDNSVFKDSLITSGVDADFSLSATLDRETRYIYDDAGRLRSTEEENGSRDRITTHEYDASSRIISTTVGDRVTRFFYDKDGLLRATLNAEGNLLENTYDAAGRLLSTERFDAKITYTDQDLTQLLALVNSVESLTTHYFYDAQGRQIATVNEQGFLSRIEYNVLARTQTHIQHETPVNVSANSTLEDLIANAGIGQDTITTFDEYGRVQTVETYDGTVSRRDYDNAGRLVYSNNADGTAEQRGERWQYNHFGELSGYINGEDEATIPASPTEAQLSAAIDDRGTRYHYDGLGRRVAEEGPNGQKSLFYYDKVGRLSHTLQFISDAADAQAAVSITNYNNFGDISNTRILTNTIATSELVGGDQVSLLSDRVSDAEDDTEDATIERLYNQLGGMTFMTNELGNSTTYVRSAYNEVDLVLRPGATGSVLQQIFYDKLGRETARIEDFQARTETKYDNLGRVDELINARNYKTGFDYTDNGRKVTTIDAKNIRRTVEYDAFGRIKNQEDVSPDRVTSYVYDDLNRTLTVTTPENYSRTTTYNRHGEIAHQSDANNVSQALRYTYTKDGNVDETFDAKGVKILDNNYDESGRLTSTLDARGVETQYIYDEANRLEKSIVDPGENGLNIQTRYEYDGQNRRINVIEADGTAMARETLTHYYADGKVKQIIEDAVVGGQKLSSYFHYDAAGNLVREEKGTESDPNQYATEYEYDDLNRRVAEILDPDGKPLRTEFRYDLENNLTHVVDANNNTTTYIYDELNRQTNVINAENEETEFLYNVLGQQYETRKLGASANEHQSTYYAFDKDDRITHTISKVSIDRWVVSQNEYDGNNNVIATRRFTNALTATEVVSLVNTTGIITESAMITEGFNEDSETTITTHFTYDNNNRLRYTVGAGGSVEENVYDLAGNITETIRYSGKLSEYTLENNAPFSEGELDDYVADLGGGDSNLHTHFAFDSAGRQTFVVDGEGGVTETRYNTLNQISSVTRYETPVGSSVAKTDAGLKEALEAAQDQTISYIYDAAGRQTYTVDAEGYVSQVDYDDAGRIIRQVKYAEKITSTVSINQSSLAQAYSSLGVQDQEQHFIYDGANRQRFTITYVDENSNRKSYEVSENVYDDAGNLVETRQFDYRFSHGEAIDSAAERDDPHAAIISLLRNVGDFEFQNWLSEGEIKQTNSWNALRHFFAYDDANRLRFTVNGVGEITETQYDNLGRISHTIQHAVDNLDFGDDFSEENIVSLLQGVTDTSGNITTRYFYDTMGRQIFTLDNASQLSHTEYNNLGQIKRVTRFKNLAETQNTTTALLSFVENNATSEDQTEQYIYDKAGRRAFTINAQNELRSYVYDGLGRVTKSLQFLQYVNVRANLDYGFLHMAFAEDTALWSGNRIEFNIFDNANRERFTVQRSKDDEWIVTEKLFDAFGNIVEQRNFDKHLKLSDIVSLMEEGMSETEVIKTLQKPDFGYSFENWGDDSNTPLESRRTHFNYDKRNRLRETTDANGNRVEQHYDAFGNVIESIQYSNEDSSKDIRTYHIYNPANRLAFTIDGEKAVTKHNYNVLGQLSEVVQYKLKIIDDINSLDERSYSVIQNHIRVDSNGNDQTTSYYYDGAGRRSYTVDAMGQISAQHFNALGQVSSLVEYAPTTRSPGSTFEALETNLRNNGNSDNIETRYYYDELGRLESEINPEGGVVKFEYDEFGQVKKETRFLISLQEGESIDDVQTSSGDRITERVFDLLGREIYLINGGSTLTKTSYNSFGERESVLHFDLDPENSVDMNLTANKTNLDQIAQSRSLGDGRTRGESFGYDRLGRLVSVTDALNNTESYTYDVLGNKDSYKDKRGNTWTYEYDNIGRLTREISPKTEFLLQSELRTAAAQQRELVKETQYDAFGNVLHVTEGIFVDSEGNYNRSDARTSSYEYDKANRLTKEFSPEAEIVDSTSADAIAVAGRRIMSAFNYDAFGNAYLVFEGIIVEPDGSHNMNSARATFFSHDKLGRQTETAPLTVYSEADGRFYSSSASAGEGNEVISKTTEVLYDNFGNAVRNKIRIANTGNAANDFAYEFHTYNELGQLIHEVDKMGYVTKYDYNSFGEVSTLTRYENPVSPDFGDAEYWTVGELDAALTENNPESDQTRVITTRYDVLGRKILVLSNATSGRGYTSSDQYSTYTPDQGEMTTGYNIGSRKIFSYNSLGDLVQEHYKISGNEEAVTWHYYDELGRETLSVDAMGYATKMEYDNANNLVRVTEFSQALEPTSDRIPPTLQYTANKDRMTAYAYNKLNLQTSVTRYNRFDGREMDFDVYSLDGNNDWTLENEASYVVSENRYDALGNVRVAQKNNKADGAANQVVETIYDGLGRVKTVKENTVAVARFGNGGGDVQLGGLDPFKSLPNFVTPTTNFSYDVFGNIRQINKSVGSANLGSFKEIYVYDHNGNRIEEHQIVPNENTRSKYFRYDIFGQMTEERLDMLQDKITRYHYDLVGNQIAALNVVTVQLGDSNSTLRQGGRVFEFNAFGEQTRTLMASGGADTEFADLTLAEVEKLEYDRLGRVSKKVEAGKGEISYFYDLVGNVTREEHRGLLKNSNLYPIQATDLRVTENVYDRLGRLTVQYQPGFRAVSDSSSASSSSNFVVPVVRQEYDRWGNVIKHWDAEVNAKENDQYVEYEYDHDNRLIRTIEKAAKYYDKNGELLAGEQRHIQDTRYDMLGNQIEQVDSVIGVDEYGTSVSEVLRKRVNEYNTRGQLATTIDGTNVRMEYLYDAMGNRVAERDGLGNVRLKTFDVWGNQVERSVLRTNLNKGTASYEYYDSRGNTTKDRNEHLEIYLQNSYVYDEANRLVEEVSYFDKTDSAAKSFTYNELDNLTRSSNEENIVTRYRFDEFGRKTWEANELDHVKTWYYSSDLPVELSDENPNEILRTGTEDLSGEKTWMYWGALKSHYIRDYNSSSLGTLVHSAKYGYNNFGELAIEKTGNVIKENTYLDNGLLKSIEKVYETGTLGGLVDANGDEVSSGGSVYASITEYNNGSLWRGEDYRKISQKDSYDYDIRQNKVREINDAVATYETLVKSSSSNKYEYRVFRDSTRKNQYMQYDNLGRLEKVWAPSGHTMNFHEEYTSFGVHDLEHNRIWDPINNEHFYPVTKHFNRVGKRNSTSQLHELSYKYDVLGNKLNTYARYFEHQNDVQVQDVWNSYDAEGRLLIANGEFKNGELYVDRSANSQLLEYDAAGRRSFLMQYIGLDTEKLNKFGATKVVGEKWRIEKYDYSDLDQVSKTYSSIETVEGSLTELELNQYKNVDKNVDLSLESRQEYDLQGRATVKYEKFDTRDNYRIINEYYDDGRIMKTEAVEHRIINDQLQDEIQFASYYDRLNDYDEAGNLLRYKYIGGTSSPEIDYYNSYGFELGAYQLRTTSYAPGIITRSYDMFGNMVHKEIEGTHENEAKSYHYNAGGLLINLGGHEVNVGTTKQDLLYIDDNQIASFGNDMGSVFDYSYTPFSDAYPATAPGTYIVQGGETLLSIARANYGDSSFWYLIAEANGLSVAPTEALPAEYVGRPIEIPNSNTSVHNNTTTIKPYNPGEIIGNKTPAPLTPPGNASGCAKVAQFVIVAVAITVTIYTGFTASHLLTQATGMTAGQVLVASSAIGAFAGSVASQGLSMQLGLSDSISFKQALSAGIAGGITAGITGGGVENFIDGLAKGVTGYAANQYANRLVGIETHFNWTDLAISAFTSGVGGAIGSVAPTQGLGKHMFNVVENVFTSSLGAQLSYDAGRGPKPDMQQIAINAFGSAVANMAVQKIMPKPRTLIGLPVHEEEHAIRISRGGKHIPTYFKAVEGEDLSDDFIDAFIDNEKRSEYVSKSLERFQNNFLVDVPTEEGLAPFDSENAAAIMKVQYDDNAVDNDGNPLFAIIQSDPRKENFGLITVGPRFFDDDYRVPPEMLNREAGFTQQDVDYIKNLSREDFELFFFRHELEHLLKRNRDIKAPYESLDKTLPKYRKDEPWEIQATKKALEWIKLGGRGNAHVNLNFDIGQWLGLASLPQGTGGSIATSFEAISSTDTLVQDNEEDYFSMFLSDIKGEFISSVSELKNDLLGKRDSILQTGQLIVDSVAGILKEYDAGKPRAVELGGAAGLEFDWGYFGGEIGLSFNPDGSGDIGIAPMGGLGVEPLNNLATGVINTQFDLEYGKTTTRRDFLGTLSSWFVPSFYAEGSLLGSATADARTLINGVQVTTDLSLGNGNLYFSSNHGYAFDPEEKLGLSRHLVQGITAGFALGKAPLFNAELTAEKSFALTTDGFGPTKAGKYLYEYLAFELRMAGTLTNMLVNAPIQAIGAASGVRPEIFKVYDFNHTEPQQ